MWTVLCIIAAPPTYHYLRYKDGLKPQESIRKQIWIYGRIWVKFVAIFMPVTQHYTALPSPCVIVANHSSCLDVYFMGAQPQWNVCMAVKGWPFKLPGYAWFMKAAGYLNLDNLTLDEILERSGAVLASGASLLFFPEGTRSRDGKLGRFHSGAFLVATLTGVPVTPLCILGTHKLLPPGSRLIRSSEISVRALESVDVGPYQRAPGGHKDLLKTVRSKMVSLICSDKTE